MREQLVDGLSSDYRVHPGGTWRAEGRSWKRPGSKGSNVEAVDWGDEADVLLTERALAVLRAANRL